MKRLFLSILLFSLAFTNFGLAQGELFRVDTTTNFLNEKYNLSYDYKLVRKDTVRHGHFFLHKPIFHNEEDSFMTFKNIEGWYNEGNLDSIWSISNGKIQPVGEGVFKDSKYSFQVSGSETISQIVYRKGEPTSSWSVFDRTIEYSEVKDTVFSLCVKRPNELGHKVIEIQKDRESLTYIIDSNGSPTGTWVYNEKLDKGIHQRKWFYKNQQLIKKEINRSDTIVEISFIQDAPEGQDIVKTEIELDYDYFEIIDIIASYVSPEGFRYISRQRPSVPLLTSAKNKLLESENYFRGLTGDVNYYEGAVKLKTYPYSNKEIEQLETISNNVTKIISQIDTIESDPQVNLASLSSDVVLRYLAVLKYFKTDMISPFLNLVELYDDEKLIYLVRDDKLLNRFQYDSLINIETQSEDGTPFEIFSMKASKGDDNQSALEKIIAYSGNLLKEVNLITDSLDSYLFELKREENLVALEKDLLKKYENNKELCEIIITDQINDLAGYDVQKVILDFLDGELSSYSKLEKVDMKMKKVEPLIDCMSNIERLLYTIENVPENIQIVEDGYTRTVFNPYTFTNMDEKIKQPIYRAFNQSLMPYIFDQVRGMKCESVRAVDRNITNLFEGMVDLLKKDTKKLERRVRRMSDPQKIADLLEIKIDAN